MSRNKAYIAGKVSGMDYNAVKAEFDRTAAQLRQRGYKVVSPVEFVSPTATWEEAMRQCIVRLMECQEAFFLPNWRDSRGACLEHRLCIDLGMVVHYVLEPKTQEE